VWGARWFTRWSTRAQVAGAYIADLVVEDCIIVELKAVKSLNELMQAQLINYLRLSGLQVGYLVNMAGSEVVWKRLVLSG
jgi:GxxExxY protein